MLAQVPALLSHLQFVDVQGCTGCDAPSVAILRASMPRLQVLTPSAAAGNRRRGLSGGGPDKDVKMDG